jgi:hypothetical protein
MYYIMCYVHITYTYKQEPGKIGWEIQVSNPKDIKHILLKHGKYFNGSIIIKN